jgi:hypothetical protein
MVAYPDITRFSSSVRLGGDSGLDGSYSRTAFTTWSYVDFLLTRLYS